MNGTARNWPMILALLTGICVLAVSAIYADLEMGYYSAGNLGSITQSAPPNLEPNGAYIVAAYPRYRLDLAPGGRRAGHRLLLQHVPLAGLHHHATAASGSHMGS